MSSHQEMAQLRAGEFTQESPTVVVLRETNHRIGNMLMILAAELRHELSGIASADIRGLLSRHERRIADFGELNCLLAIGEFDPEVSGQVYLSNLIEILSRAILSPINVHCEAQVGDGALSSEQCKWVGRVIAELVMNSAKHAFKDLEGGLVLVNLVCSGGSWLCTVLDDGVGIHGGYSGTGSQIVASLVQLLEGNMTTVSGPWGTEISVAFPAAATVPALDDLGGHASSLPTR
jgi:two-component system, sensor histidine kinase PdtaS